MGVCADLETLTQLLESTMKHSLCTAADCEFLAHDIESKTGEHVGVNTIKRMIGMLADERQPRETTLNVLAKYLGFTDWATLKEVERNSNSAFSASDVDINASELKVGSKIHFSYLPDRDVTIVYRGNSQFVVEQSVNSKLHADDVLMLSHIVDGYPLIVDEVQRDGKSLGAFTAGIATGISDVKKV